MNMAYNFDTLKIRAGYNPLEHNNAVSVPIYQTVAYEMGSTARADALFAFELEDPLYTRVSNPTVQVLEKRVAALHGVDYAVAVASGMAAISYTVLALAAKGGRILTSPRLYGGAVDGFHSILEELGVNYDMIADPDDPQEFERNIKEDTKAIYIETISNPLATVLDFDAIAEIAHKHGIPLIVDNTAATPYLFNPFEHGADIVVYSATKALCGHGNVIAGIVLEKGGFNYDPAKFPILDRKLWFLRDRNENPRSILDIFPVSPVTGKIRAVHLNYLGAALSPFDAYLILLGIETLSERVAKQTTSAVKIVKYLETNKHVNWISYPYAAGSKYKALADKYLPKGAGGIFSFEFNGTEEQKRKFIESVNIFGYQANIGDARSLIVNPAQTTHGELTHEQRDVTGLSINTIRLSIGLEDPQDLIDDLDQAFEKAFT